MSRKVNEAQSHEVSKNDAGIGIIIMIVFALFVACCNCCMMRLTVLAGLLVGSTDTKHYLELSPNIYRFSPTFMYPPDIRRFHGDNERISVENYGQAINYYSHLITNADREALVAARHEMHSADL